MKIRRITARDEEWPSQLSELGGYTTPKILNLVGGPLSAYERSIAIVGTRRPTLTGVETAHEFARALAGRGFTIVSGLALGIDAAAHKGALEAGGHTVAVLGCGLDIVFPSNNARVRKRIVEEGTLVSEYPEGTPPLTHHFPARNRIIAGLSKGVVVVEGGMKSGARITARIGADAGRDVCAVPGSIRNPVATAPNQLIQMGAALVTTPEEVLGALFPGRVIEVGETEPVLIPDLGDVERKVLLILDDIPSAAERIAQHLGTDIGRIRLALANLEIDGLVVRRPMGYQPSEGGSKVRAALVNAHLGAGRRPVVVG